MVGIHEAGQDIGLGCGEFRDRIGEVVGRDRERAGCGFIKAAGLEHRRQAELGIHESLARLVVEEERADLLVRLDLAHQRNKGLEDGVGTGKEMERIGEALVRRSAAREQPALPRDHGGNRRNAAAVCEFADCDRAIAVLRQNQIAAFAQNKFAGDGGGAVRVGLVVANDQLDIVFLSADVQPLGQMLLHLLDRPAFRFAKGGADAREAADIADLDLGAGASCDSGRKQCGCNGCAANLQDCTTGYGCLVSKKIHDDVSQFVVAC